MPVVLDLHYVDELIEVRQQQHGGARGAPGVIGGYRQGESLNRSCIVMISALIQGFVEDVFVEASQQVLPNLTTAASIERYRQSFKRWGNPHPSNMKALFSRIGIEDPLDGLSWRNCTNATVRVRLSNLNEIRNQIAHGRRDINLNGRNFTLTLATARGFRDFAEAFGGRFEAHVIRVLR
jgi:hypothetical protein